MSNTALVILDTIAGAGIAMILSFIALRLMQWAAVNLFILALRALNALKRFIDVSERWIAREAKAALLLMFRLSCWAVRSALSAVTRPLWSRVAPKLHAVRERVKRWIAEFDRASKRPKAAARAEPRLEQARSKPAQAHRMSHEEAFKLTLLTIEKAKQRR